MSRTNLPRDYDPAEPLRHPAWEDRQKPTQEEMNTTRTFLSKFHRGHRLSSEEIFAALVDIKKDAAWFAERLAAILDRGTARDKLRGMELLSRLLMHKEGVKVKVGELDDRETGDIQEEHDRIMAELKDAAMKGSDS